MTHLTYRTYLVHFLLALLLCLGSVVIINAAVDPYDLFGTAKIGGFNEHKAVISSKQRVFETVQVLRRKDEAIILGTSRSDIGISPEHPIFPKGKTFNAAMSGQQILETRRIIEELLKHPGNTPKTVVIGLDFFAFNALMPAPFDYSDDNFSAWRTTALLFSISTTLDAFRTVIRQNRQAILEKGGLLHDDGLREYIGNPAMSARARFLGNEEGYLRFTYKPAPACAWDAIDAQHGIDSYQDFRRIIELAHEHAIILKLFISPSHARQWETLAAAGLWKEFEEWKRTLVSINEEVAGQHGHLPTPLWDFSGYNRITTEAVPSDDTVDMKNYWESSHYHKEVGDMVLNRIFEAEKKGYPSDFGIILNNQNIEGWLSKTRALQQRYRNTHTHDIEEINLLAKTIASNGPCSKR